MYLLSGMIIMVSCLSVICYKSCLVNQGKYNKVGLDKWFVFICMGGLCILNCLRSLDTGNDTYSYYNLFHYYSTGKSLVDFSKVGLNWANHDIELGYRVINKGWSYISSSYQLFISIIAIFVFFVAARFIMAYSKNKAVSVLLFVLLFFHPYINALRQVIAISILLISFNMLIKKRYVRYFIMVLFASLFHKTAIVSLLNIIAVEINPTKKKTAIIIGGISVITVFNGLRVLLGSFISSSGVYIGTEAGISNVWSIVKNVLILLTMLYWIKSYESLNLLSEDSIGDDIYILRMNRFYLWIPIFSLAASIASMSIPVLNRFEYYFSIYYICSIPYFLEVSKRTMTNKRIVFDFLLIVLSIYLYGVIWFRPEWMTEYNYHFFWQ